VNKIRKYLMKPHCLTGGRLGSAVESVERPFDANDDPRANLIRVPTTTRIESSCPSRNPTSLRRARRRSKRFHFDGFGPGACTRSWASP
jgi:hypothetical protein